MAEPDELFLKMMARIDEAAKRHTDFLQLVQTACLLYDMATLVAGERALRAVYVVREAQKLDPALLPDDLEAATWEFVDHFYMGKERPAWLPETES